MTNRLTFVRNTTLKESRMHGIFQCICGVQKELRVYHVEKNIIRSCGCLQQEIASSLFTTHGASKTSEYHIWKTIIQRMTNPKCKSYKNYRGRGLILDSSWLQFKNFLNDMGPRPSPRHSIERVENNEGYTKSNCIWALPVVQANNKRNNHYLTLNGTTLNVQQWAIKLDIDHKVLRRRIRLKWTDENILTKPIRLRNANIV